MDSETNTIFPRSQSTTNRNPSAACTTKTRRKDDVMRARRQNVKLSSILTLRCCYKQIHIFIIEWIWLFFELLIKCICKSWQKGKTKHKKREHLNIKKQKQDALSKFNSYCASFELWVQHMIDRWGLSTKSLNRNQLCCLPWGLNVLAPPQEGMMVYSLFQKRRSLTLKR